MAPKSIGPAAVGAAPPSIPVRDAAGARLPVEMIRYFAKVAMDHARRNPSERFKVVGTGYGYPAKVIAPMFDYCPPNVSLPYEFMY